MAFPLNLSSHKVEALCARIAAVLVAAWRAWKFRSAQGDFFASLIEALLAGALLPAACAFVLYPFYDTPPDLTRYQLYLLVSGTGLLYVAFIIIRRSLQPEREKRIKE